MHGRACTCPLRCHSSLSHAPQVENNPEDFTLCVQHDTGTMEPFREEDTPLMVRLKLGQSEDMAKIYVLEASEARLMEGTKVRRYT